MTKTPRTPRRAPEGALLSATDAADLLGIGRTRFWQLRKEFNLQRVEWSPETRPLYRRDDVLKLLGPQGGQDAPAGTPAEPSPQAATPPAPAKSRLAVDAGFKVMPGFEHITVEEWHEANRDATKRRQSAHLPDID